MFSDTSDVIDIFTSELELYSLVILYNYYRELRHPSPRCGLVWILQAVYFPAKKFMVI